jgi:HAMP domain-containing protein
LKLLVKFSLIFIIVFGMGLAITAEICHRFLQESARDQVLRQAELMMEASLSIRTYTSKQVKPLVESRRRDEPFRPQSVPGYAATENFKYLRAKYPEYTYKEATLNPTNPRDRAVEWESDVVNIFRNDATRTSFSAERDTPNGRSLYLARPIVAAQGCLECHSTAKAAPPNMLKLYGAANGFGWKAGEIIGAQIVSVPMEVPVKLAETAFRKLITGLGLVAVITLIVLNLALSFTVIRPVSRFAASADEISKGNLDVPELPVKGKDEIAVLAGAFNRMHRSLVKAMKMLEHE